LQAIRVDILLPRFYNPDSSGVSKKIEAHKISTTLLEIEDNFNGYTLHDIPIIGSWVNPKTGENMKDSHRTVWVSAKRTASNFRKFRQLKKKWKERFNQDDIMIYYITIDML
jgi:hypothetical protein